jgi:enoyl-CoA hydratase/carnithine racemase
MMAADDSVVSMTIAGPVATVMFDRPMVRNAMLYRSWSLLEQSIVAADSDAAVQVIVLRGANGHFGAGNDIAEFGRLRGDADGARRYGWAMAGAMKAIETASKPVIAAIEGACYGASVALALSADIRIAANTANFAITPAKLGALYLRSDHHRLVSAIGPGRARQMIFTARSMTAVHAYAVGLVDEAVSSESFELELALLCADIAKGSRYTLHHSKRMLRTALPAEVPDETEDSIGWFVAAMMGADFAEGVEAFLAKRAPVFSGAMEAR